MPTPTLPVELDRERRALGVKVGRERDEQRGDGRGDECAAGTDVMASEHNICLLIVWKLPLRVLFRDCVR